LQHARGERAKGQAASQQSPWDVGAEKLILEAQSAEDLARPPEAQQESSDGGAEAISIV